MINGKIDVSGGSTDRTEKKRSVRQGHLNRMDEKQTEKIRRWTAPGRRKRLRPRRT